MEKQAENLNIAKSLIVFTFPLILSGVLQQLFNWADAFIVGNTNGESALAGVGATTSVYHLFVNVIVGFTTGISVLTAQIFGKNEKEKIVNILSVFVTVLGMGFFAVTVLGFFLTDEILILLDTPEDIFKISKEYLKILVIGLPCLAVYNVYSAVLRGLGDSRAPFLSVLFCSAVNIALDVFLVIVCSFGAAGAAAATAVSQTAMMVFIVFYTIKKYPQLKFRFSCKYIEKDIFIKGLKFGIPSALQGGINSIGNIVLQRFMNSFGQQTVAAITTAYRVDSVIILPISNFGSGIAAIAARYIGSGSKDQAKKVLKTGSVIISAISACLTLLVLVTGSSLIAMFGLTAESAEIGKHFFHTVASCYMIYGLAMALRGYMEGMGDMVFSSIAGIISLSARIFISYAFAFSGNMIIAYAEMISWIILAAFYFVRFIQKGR